MSRRIFKTGNSLVVSLPKEAIEYLHQVGENAEVNVSLDRTNRQIVIAPEMKQGVTLRAGICCNRGEIGTFSLAARCPVYKSGPRLRRFFTLADPDQ